MFIELNGKITEINCSTAFETRDLYGINCDVVILNGFQLEKDHPIKDKDVLVLIKKGQMPDKDELESMMMARHTPEVQKKVKMGKVAVAGLGGLGSNIAVMLARLGVGNLLLVDFDVVEPSNLNRQSYYISHLGMEKTTAMKNQINEINPFINVEIKNIKVTEDNAVEIFKDWDIVCEAFDKPNFKAILVNKILEELPNTKIVSASGMAGYCSSNSIITKRIMKNLYLCGDMKNEAKPGCGLMAPRVQICAGHQANAVLRLLLELEDI